MMRTAKITTFLVFLLSVACNNPDVNEPISTSAFIENADCEGFCQFEQTCLTTESEEDIIEYCEDLCKLAEDAFVCQYDEFTDYCKKVYKAYHDCAYTVDTCEDAAAHAVRMLYADDPNGITEQNDFCREEMVHLWSYCFTGKEMDAVSEHCGDDLNDYVDFREDIDLEDAPYAADAGDDTDQ